MVRFLRTAVITAIVAGGLASCGGMPRHGEIRVEQQAALLFKGGVGGERVLVDNIDVAQLVTGEDVVVAVKSGTHSVRVNLQSQTVYERTVFIQGNTRKVIILNGK